MSTMASPTSMPASDVESPGFPALAGETDLTQHSAMLVDAPEAGASDTSSSTNRCLPASSFYWSVIDCDDVPEHRRGGSHPGARAILEERFQADLPLPIESLVVVFMSVPGSNAALACGLQRETLGSILASTPSLLRLGPGSVPEPFLEFTLGIDANNINLLVGEYEPPVLAKLQTNRRRIAMVATTVALVIASFGARWRSHEAQLASSLLLDHATSSVQKAGLVGLPEQLRNPNSGAELARVRSRLLVTHGPAAGRALPPDASESLEALLAAWPKDLETRPGRISVSEQAITLAVEVPDQSAASTLGRSLAVIQGWELQPPQAVRNGASVQVSASLKRAAASKGVP